MARQLARPVSRWCWRRVIRKRVKQQPRSCVKKATTHTARSSFDVTETSDFAPAAAFLDQKFGHLDILINNAGVSGGSSSAAASQARCR